MLKKKDSCHLKTMTDKRSPKNLRKILKLKFDAFFQKREFYPKNSNANKTLKSYGF